MKFLATHQSFCFVRIFWQILLDQNLQLIHYYNQEFDIRSSTILFGRIGKRMK
ncbi:unnamed protein product [Paramecium octaurelia]|uniref:Uncharacterized protein n=1 Tax=Paramecium octaurelia TaxID=43137 RepID=A0A8S1WP97_PAROT|nr:unnamed protein product [Paramecium octaurelia]